MITQELHRDFSQQDIQILFQKDDVKTEIRHDTPCNSVSNKFDNAYLSQSGKGNIFRNNVNLQICLNG